MLNRNQVETIGHLASDPLVFDKSAIVKVAVNKPPRKNPQTGQMEEQQPDYVEGKILNEQRIGFVRNHMKKGQHVVMEGRLRITNFQDSATGETKYEQEYLVSKIDWVGAKQTSA